MQDSTLEARVDEYWDWVAVCLFLLLAVDLLTSMIAADVVGLRYESNPLMAWLFTQSLVVIVGVHLVALVLAVVFFYGLFELLRGTRPPVRAPMVRMLEVYLGLLVGVGLFVMANNLSVLLLGRSLL